MLSCLITTALALKDSLLNVMYCVCMMVRIMCEARSNFWIAGQLQVHMVS